jgi:hypothetical protein
MTMMISVRIRDINILRNRNYSFFSKADSLLRLEKEFFAHIMSPDIKAVQVRNISEKSYIISKNFKIERIKDFSEEDCHLTTSEDRHLTIISEQQSMNVVNVLKSTFKSDE